jgi:hypothetical protein
MWDIAYERKSALDARSVVFHCRRTLKNNGYETQVAQSLAVGNLLSRPTLRSELGNAASSVWGNRTESGGPMTRRLAGTNA